MTPGAILSLVPMLLGLVAMQPGAYQQTVSRLVIEDQVILRIPVQPHPLVPQRILWMQTNRGPNCIPVAGIRRVLLLGPERIDFVLANRARVRAEFDENCQALDYYGDVYLQPADARLCAGRDAVHSRMGGSCTIARFKQLVPRLIRP